MGFEISEGRKKRLARARRGAAKRRNERSGEVVTYRKGEEKPALPEPTQRQVERRDWRL